MRKVLAWIKGGTNERDSVWKPPFQVGVWPTSKEKNVGLIFEDDDDVPSLWLLKEDKPKGSDNNNNNNKGSVLMGLDTGVWSIIFSYLPLQSFVMTVPLVCKRWRQVAYSDLTWKAWSKRHIVKVLPVTPGSPARTQIVCNYLYTKRFPKRVWLPPGLRHLKVSQPSTGELPQTLRIHLLGGYSGAGTCKSLIRCCTGLFLEEYDPYLEDSYRKQIYGCVVDCTIMAAQEEYSAMRDQHLHNCDLFWIGHDLRRNSSIDAIEDEINPIVQQYLRVKDVSWAPLIVMRTKADSDFDEHRDESSWPRVREFLRHIQVPLVPVSAKENTGFDDLINLSLQMILWHRKSKGWVQTRK